MSNSEETQELPAGADDFPEYNEVDAAVGGSELPADSFSAEAADFEAEAGCAG